MNRHPREENLRGWLRLAFRVAALAAATVLLWPAIPLPGAARLVPALSPYVAICSTAATGVISTATLFGLPVLALALVWRRWFCRWGCPVGLMAQYAGRLNPWCRGVHRFLPPLGTWIALATLGGAAFGYPLFLWLDPLALFGAAFGLRGGAGTTAGLIGALGLACVLLLSVLLPGAWCMKVCPLGATQELLAWPRRACAALLSAKPAASGPETSPRENDRLRRRRLVWLCLGAISAGAGARLGCHLRHGGEGSVRRTLRPPGSLDERAFVGLCLRCGNCVRACPAKIIRPDLGARDITAFFAPALNFARDYCREDCARCTEVCPSGAIGRLTAEEKRRAKIGLARVDMSLCRLSEGRECDRCARICPYRAIDIRWSGYAADIRIEPARCPGCGACQLVCPTSPRKAITVEPVGPPNDIRRRFPRAESSQPFSA